MEKFKAEKVRDFRSAIHKIYPEYEKRKFQENIKNDILIIDIDGVLLDFDIKSFFIGLFLILFSKEKFKKFVKNKKIPLSYLLMIKRLVNEGCKIIILTSRKLDKEKEYFPYISKDFAEKMKKKGIGLFSIKKYGFDLKLPNSLLNELDRERIIYLGSGIFDKRVFNKMKGKLKGKNLIYYDIGLSKIL